MYIYNVMEKYMTSHLFDIIVYRQSNCDYRKIIAVPSYGLTVGKNNGYANIIVWHHITYIFNSQQQRKTFSWVCHEVCSSSIIINVNHLKSIAKRKKSNKILTKSTKPNVIIADSLTAPNQQFSGKLRTF